MKTSLLLLVAVFFTAGILTSVWAITVQEAEKIVAGAEKSLAAAQKVYTEKTKAVEDAKKKAGIFYQKNTNYLKALTEQTRASDDVKKCMDHLTAAQKQLADAKKPKRG